MLLLLLRGMRFPIHRSSLYGLEQPSRRWLLRPVHRTTCRLVQSACFIGCWERALRNHRRIPSVCIDETMLSRSTRKFSSHTMKHFIRPMTFFPGPLKNYPEPMDLFLKNLEIPEIPKIPEIQMLRRSDKPTSTQANDPTGHLFDTFSSGMFLHNVVQHDREHHPAPQSRFFL